MTAGRREALRHSRLVRVTHWINALAFGVLVASGTGIFFAHPELYWGETGYYGDPTAFSFGLEMNLEHARWGRNYHFLFAWVFLINGAVYVICNLLNRHFRRKMLPTREQLHPRNIWAELRDHLRFRAPPQQVARGYNLLQKLAYLGVIFVLCPLMLLTGLTMSPSVTAAFPKLFALFGGRQSARTIHFIAANLLVLFFVVHIVQVFVVGAADEVRAMITGRSATPRARPR